MPEKWPQEIKEISRELGDEEDTTLVAADKLGGGFDEDEQNVKYTPIAIGEKIYVRENESTRDWKNYRLEITFVDGTHQEFVFTAKDEGAAKKAVADRKSLVSQQDGTFKLVEILAPKELESGELGQGQKTVESNEEEVEKKATKRSAKANKAAAKADEAPKADKASARSDTSEK